MHEKLMEVDHTDAAVRRLNQSIGNVRMGPSYQHPEGCTDCDQAPVDLVDELSMESFPCSDPPSFSSYHI